MSAVLAVCRCSNGGDPIDGQDFACTAVATQEDLLCDDCREGCNFGIAGQPHMVIEGLKLPVIVVPRQAGS